MHRATAHRFPDDPESVDRRYRSKAWEAIVVIIVVSWTALLVKYFMVLQPFSR